MTKDFCAHLQSGNSANVLTARAALQPWERHRLSLEHCVWQNMHQPTRKSDWPEFSLPDVLLKGA